MSILNVNLNDVSEPKPLEKGRYQVMITACQATTSERSGKDSLRVTIGFPDHPDAPTFNHYVSLPTEDDEKLAFKLLMLKRFLVAFRIPFGANGIDTDEICQIAVGQTAMCDIGLTEPTDERPQVYNTLILPRLATEEKQNEQSHSGRRHR